MRNNLGRQIVQRYDKGQFFIRLVVQFVAKDPPVYNIHYT